MQLLSGDSWSWTESFPDYSAVDYTCKVILKLKDNPAIVLTATASGTDFLYTILPTITNIPSGIYYYVIKMELKTGDHGVTTIEGSGLTSTIQVLPNLESNQDPRSPWRIIYDSLLDKVMQLANQTVSETEYNGRKFTFKNISELMMERDYAKMMMEVDEGIAGSQSPKIQESY